jgi:hypothetical protein
MIPCRTGLEKRSQSGQESGVGELAPTPPRPWASAPNEPNFGESDLDDKCCVDKEL